MASLRNRHKAHPHHRSAPVTISESAAVADLRTTSPPISYVDILPAASLTSQSLQGHNQQIGREMVRERQMSNVSARSRGSASGGSGGGGGTWSSFHKSSHATPNGYSIHNGIGNVDHPFGSNNDFVSGCADGHARNGHNTNAYPANGAAVSWAAEGPRPEGIFPPPLKPFSL